MGWRRYLPCAAVVIFFLVASAWLGRDRRMAREAYEPCSVYSTSPEGLSLAYEYLRERARRRGGGKVDVLTRPVERAALEPGAVLFRVGPSTRSLPEELRQRPKDRGRGFRSRPASGLFTAAEESWVGGGGRLVLATGEDYGPLEVERSGSGTVRKVYPVWPGVEELKPARKRVLAGKALDRMHGVFTAGEGTLLARRLVGEGEVFVLSCPEIFKNGRLGQADHLALLEELSGRGRRVYFDEYVHGIHGGAGVLGLMRRAGLGPMLFLLLAAALTAYWRRRRRIGPEEDPYRETRVESVDFVDSLAQLYDRALAQRQALSLYHRAFVRSVSAKTGLRGEALEGKVRELTEGLDAPAPRGGRDVGAQEFRRRLAALNDAFRRLADVRRA